MAYLDYRAAHLAIHHLILQSPLHIPLIDRMQTALVYQPQAFYSTSTPIERAVPATTFLTASISSVFISFTFCAAISLSCASVSFFSIFSRFGTPDPFSIPSLARIKSSVGWLTTLKSIVRSSYILM